MLRLAERDHVRRVLGKAQAVVVSLDRAVALIGCPFRHGASPVFVDLAGYRLPADTERNAGGSAEVTFVGGIDEDLSLVCFGAA